MKKFKWLYIWWAIYVLLVVVTMADIGLFEGSWYANAWLVVHGMILVIFWNGLISRSYRPKLVIKVRLDTKYGKGGLPAGVKNEQEII